MADQEPTGKRVALEMTHKDTASATTSTEEHVNICIVGGGIGGVALALALSLSEEDLPHGIFSAVYES